MQIVITMAGLGSRFQAAGFKLPKYQISVHGRTLFDWSMESLTDYYASENLHCFFVVRSADRANNFIIEHAESFGLKKSQISIVELDHLTDGQATSAMQAAPHWNPADELVIYNIDTYIESGTLQRKDIHGDGYIPCFHAPGDHWSFVKLDSAGRATEVREKDRISNNCTIGLYYFKSCELYSNLYHEYYDSISNLPHSEKYIAPIYNLMIQKSLDVRISLLPAEKVHVLGTPAEVAAFQKSPISHS